MDQDPLVREKIDAGAEFLKRFRKTTPVQAAFWLKPAEDDGRWNLYLWSEKFSDQNFDLAYGEVLRLAKTLQDPNFDPFEVRILRGENALAQAAIDVYKRYPAKVPTHFNGRSFGGVSVDGVYIYPALAAVTARGQTRKAKSPPVARAKRSRR
jgi:hypothetical protein